MLFLVSYLAIKHHEVKTAHPNADNYAFLPPYFALERIFKLKPTNQSPYQLKSFLSLFMIKKQILFCAVVARGELIKMLKKASLTNNEKDSANIIVAAEKVSKLFIDAGVSLFGKEQIQVIETSNNNNVAQMNMSDLLALVNSSNVS